MPPRPAEASRAGFLRGLAATIAAVLCAAGAAGVGAQSGSPPERFAMRVVTQGLDAPWEITWGPDGRLWVTERRGRRVLRVNPADGATAVALAIPEAHQSVTQDGLLGLALHPQLLKGSGNDVVFVAYTYDDAPGPAFVRRMAVRRYAYDAATGQLGSPADVLTALPVHDDHIAGRLVFGPDGMLYLSLGDEGSNFGGNRCNLNHALDLPTAAEIAAKNWTSYQGKILRIAPDGSIPRDNPTLNGVRSHVFSYGHRNPQGLVFGPGGRLFESEHGPDVDDEVNLIESGGNYGWPRVAGYRDDKAYVYANWSASSPTPCASLPQGRGAGPLPASVPQQAESTFQAPDFKPPLQTFFTLDASTEVQRRPGNTIAPGSLDIVTSPSGVPGWNTSLLLPAMLRGLIYRMVLAPDGRSVVGAPIEYFKTTNRYRDLAVAPDQRTFYIVTDNDGRTLDEKGTPVRTVANPGAILEFKYLAN
jgi:PQQ-dependent dehydrogenase (s-GDH family)